MIYDDLKDFDLKDNQRLYFCVLWVNGKIEGLSKLMESHYQKDLFWIQYLSIDKQHRSKGYSKKMLEEIFSWASENNFTIEASGYSDFGWERLRKNQQNLAKKYNVKYIDNKEEPEYFVKESKIQKFSDFKLNEYADEIHLPNGKELNLYSDGAHPFFYVNGDFYVGVENSGHIDMANDLLSDVEDDTEIDDFLDKTNHNGRIWLKDNIIGLWNIDFFDKSDVKKIIKDLEKYFEINIDPNKWYIEFYDTISNQQYLLKLKDYFEDNKDNNVYKKGFTSEEDFEKQKQLHQMSPIEKEKMNIKKPKGNKKDIPLDWKFAMRKESSNYIDYDENEYDF